MYKSQKILAGIFLGGILLGGIGTGVALVEYSSLAYAGEKEIGRENLVVQELDYAFDPSREKIRIVRGYQDRDAVVEADSSVPEGIVRYVVTYNKKIIRPTLSFWEETDWEEEYGQEGYAQQGDRQEGYGQEEYAQEEESPQQEEARMEVTEDISEAENVVPRKLICLQMETDYLGSDFGLMMENKDRILADLKEKKISSYHVVSVTDVRILANPRTISGILDRSRVYRSEYESRR